eukprot:6208740-Pleurochrysis_carterae.AAC.1
MSLLLPYALAVVLAAAPLFSKLQRQLDGPEAPRTLAADVIFSPFLYVLPASLYKHFLTLGCLSARFPTLLHNNAWMR